jgi:signal peptidase I
MEPGRQGFEDGSAASRQVVSEAAPPSDPQPELAADTEAVAPRKSAFREYAEAIIVAMLLAFAIRVFVVQAFKIPSGSMIPTLLVGDHILVSKLSYGLQWPEDCKFMMTFPPVTCYTSKPLVRFGDPQRGDIIVFRYPEDEDKDFIKRVVGMPGDVIEIRKKMVYVNGATLDDRAFTQRVDPGIIEGTITPRDNFGPVTVPEGSYFVMGDNRDQSLDSRFWGYVSENKVRGRAFRIYWSWSGQGDWTHWVRWERIGRAIR